jgi:hypothetical protein
MGYAAQKVGFPRRQLSLQFLDFEDNLGVGLDGRLIALAFLFPMFILRPTLEDEHSETGISFAESFKTTLVEFY